MSRFRRIVLCGLAAALGMALCGCGVVKTDYDRLKEERAAYVSAHRELPAETRRAILAGTLHEGMTPDQVRASWGRPWEIEKRSGGREEEWIFGCGYPHRCAGRSDRDGMVSRSRAYFGDGRLTGWTT